MYFIKCTGIYKWSFHVKTAQTLATTTTTSTLALLAGINPQCITF